MKRGYKKLLIFEIILFFVLIINSFVTDLLSSTKMIFFLLIILINFHFFFGFERDRHRYTKDIIMEELIFLSIFFLLYYLSGIYFGFAKIDNYYTLNSITTIIIPIVITIIIKEYLRYQMLIKSEGNKCLIILTTVLFIFLDISNAIKINLNHSFYDKFILMAITILPTISLNICCSYISYKTGYQPLIFLRLIIELFMYLLPFVPNPNQYLYSIIWLLVPIFLLYRIYLFYQKDKDEEILRNYHRRKIKNLIFPSIIVLCLIYITSGYFKFFSLAIASGSMSPIINKGDVVIVEKMENFDQIETGDVVVYKYNDILIVHRLIKKIKADDHYYFYTKGDANEDMDNYLITEEMIIGIVKMKIPYIGLPTVWINENKR